MRINLQYWLAISLLAFLTGCYPKGPEYTADLDLVYTNYSSDFQFSQRKTYALPDSVIEITGAVVQNQGGRPTMLSSVYASVILSQLQQGMTKNGWTLVDKNAQPDVILLPSAMTTTNIYYYYDWDYWDWWYPDYYPGWGWYYPGYYPPYVTSYRTGSVFVQMIDQKAVSPQAGNIPVVWNCILNGLAEGGSTDIISRIQTNINKAFDQSPYLKH
ncbi:MAG TPA: DUF4136 domain-containing protein [Puia sp.]|jgi:hypothetical protein